MNMGLARDFPGTLIVARREIRDQLRDWAHPDPNSHSHLVLPHSDELYGSNRGQFCRGIRCSDYRRAADPVPADGRGFFSYIGRVGDCA